MTDDGSFQRFVSQVAQRFAGQLQQGFFPGPVQLGGELVAFPVQIPVPVLLLLLERGAGVCQQRIALAFRGPERLFDPRILVR